MKIVSAAEMREIDRVTSDRFGVPSLTLMENAGAAVAEFIGREYPNARRIGIVCGKGNNGGDGFVAARKLHEAGREVRVLLLAGTDELQGDAAAMHAKVPVKSVVAHTEEELNGEAAREVYHSEVLVDAILGSGFRRPLSSLYAAAIEDFWGVLAPVVSVDIPSGAHADACKPEGNGENIARSDAIVTFTAPRPAHVFGQLTKGPVVVAGIGSPLEAIVSELKLELITAADPERSRFLFAPRAADAHKGDFGHVLVVGGSLGKAGAAAMAGMGALRAGAGLVTVATPRGVLPTVAGFAPELMTEPLEETETGSVSMRALEYDRMETIQQGKTVVAIGPGISRHSDSSSFVRAVTGRTSLPLVLDADALNAFQDHLEKLTGRGRPPLVATPHPGEMARLLGVSTREVQSDRVNVARCFAQEHQCCVVLKGYRSLIADPSGRVQVCPTGNPGMASGGTGDVLTGMIAGLIAQHPADVVGATAAAVFLHGLAGDIACERVGERALAATDLLAALPEAVRRAEALSRETWVRFR